MIYITLIFVAGIHNGNNNELIIFSQVADESAFVQFPGQTSHGMPIPPGYALVSIEKICQPDFKELELDIPGGDAEKTLKDALHGIILWPKHYIIKIPENDGSPRDHLEPGQPSSVPAASLYNCLRGRHLHYLLTHLLRNNHTTIWVNEARAITMMTSIPIHLSNHSPQALKRNHYKVLYQNQHRKSVAIDPKMVVIVLLLPFFWLKVVALVTVAIA
jgi:hypothetical protein